MALSKPHSIFACPTSVPQTWIPNWKWKLTVFDPQWSWIHRCEGLTVESQVIHRISTVFKGQLYFETWYKRLVLVCWLWSDGTMVRHFPESPFYKTEQSGAVVGKWGWGGLELHLLLPWPSVVSPEDLRVAPPGALERPGSAFSWLWALDNSLKHSEPHFPSSGQIRVDPSILQQFLWTASEVFDIFETCSILWIFFFFLERHDIVISAS